MSLLRQLLISVTLAIALILIGVVVFSVSSARQYLDTQLQAQADSTATSLALMLSQPANQDPSMRELLVAVVFDSGEFRVVEFLDPSGRILVRRAADDGAPSTVSAPRWFGGLLPFDEHRAQRQATNGWSQLGVVRLQADDGYARDALWHGTVRIVVLTLGAGLLWGAFVVFLMRWLRKAIQDDVTLRVQTIGQAADGAALPPVRHPAVVELREVSRIIANTHKQVRATASEQEAQIESLQLELHRDETTGLANRKYFLNEFRRHLEHADVQGGQVGHVMLFRQCDMKAINQAVSRRVADRWLRNMGQLVETILRERLGPDAWLARLNGSDFAFLLPMVPGPAAVRIAQAVAEMLQAQRIQLGHADLCRWRLALTDYESGQDDLSGVLSRLDEALMRAESAGHEAVEYLPGAQLAAATSSRGAGEQAWRTLLQSALAEDWFALTAQPDCGAGADVERHVGQLTVQEPGAPEPLSGYLFMPPAVRLGLSADCDVRAVELGLTWLRPRSGELVLRVSLASILQPGFQEQVVQRLVGHEQAARLLVELDSYALVADRAQVVAFAAALRGQGVRVGLRRFGEDPDALLYLHEIQPEYLRVSAALMAVQAQSIGARHLLQAVQDTAHEIGAVVDLTAAG